MPTIDSARIDIHYKIEGDGPPFVLHTDGGRGHEKGREEGY
jgi:hypothetical protein